MISGRPVKMSSVLLFLTLSLLSLTLPSSSSTIPASESQPGNSAELPPSSIQMDPSQFLPTASLFVPENAVTSQVLIDGEQSETVRPAAPVEMDQTEATSWNDVSTEVQEMDTESAPTITPEDVVQQTQAIPIESYVVTERKAKSELIPPSKAGKESSFQPEIPSIGDLGEKNLATDPEELDNALFANDTTHTESSSGEEVDQSKEGSEESFVTEVEASATNRVSPQSEEATTTTTSTSTITTTTAAPSHSNNNHNRKKQPKHIEKFRAPASEVLRYFMELAYLRSPLAILVDTSEKTLQKTKILWSATLQQSNANIDMVLATFDHSGIYGTYTFNNSRVLVAALNGIQTSDDSDHEISTHTDNVFATIIRASERIPYDSAIFLFTSSEPAEDKVAHQAAIMLLKKRIRLYLFWFGGADTDPEATATNHRNPPRDVAGILGEVALRTGGEVVFMSGDAIQANGDIGKVTLQLMNSFQGVHEPFGVAVSESETNAVNRSHESSEERTNAAVGEETSTWERSNGTAALKGGS